MKGKTKSLDERKGGVVLSILKGALIATCISLVGVLIFAFLLKFTSISDNIISPVNQVIKGISVFLGVFLGFRKERKFGLLGGLLVGLIYTVVAFITFSILDGSFIFDRVLVNDLVFGSIIGAICGIICVNIKKTSK